MKPRSLLFMTSGLGDTLLSLPLAMELEEHCDSAVVVARGPQEELARACLPGSRLVLWSSAADLPALLAEGMRRDRWFYTISACQRKFRLLGLANPFARKLGFTAMVTQKSWQTELALDLALVPNFAEPAWKNNLRLFAESFGKREVLLSEWDDYSARTRSRILHAIRPPVEGGLRLAGSPVREREPGLVVHAGSHRYPGGLERYKRWPLDRFVETVENLRALGRFSKAYWFVGPEDLDIAQGLAKRGVAADGTGGYHELVSHAEFGSSLVRLAGFLASMRGMLTNDSGIAHLATLVQLPLTSIASGIGMASYSGQNGSRSRVISRETPCRGCTMGITPETARAFKCFNEWRCMDSITVDEVTESVARWAMGGFRSAGSEVVH